MHSSGRRGLEEGCRGKKTDSKKARTSALFLRPAFPPLYFCRALYGNSRLARLCCDLFALRYYFFVRSSSTGEEMKRDETELTEQLPLHAADNDVDHESRRIHNASGGRR